MIALRKFYEWTRPRYDAALRVYLGCYMVTTGVARLITGSTARPINIIPARVYGSFFVALGLGLVLTRAWHYRAHWPGRIVVIMATGTWILLIADSWGSWVSIAGASLAALAIANEVRVDER